MRQTSVCVNINNDEKGVVMTASFLLFRSEGEGQNVPLAHKMIGEGVDF